MKLDKRIDKDCKIYSCFDAEQAQKYINTKGYFTDFYEKFKDIGELFHGTLMCIDKNSAFSYEFSNDDFSNCYKFFLPEKFVKKEKKLRPYKNISEFYNSTGCKILGSDCILIRNKNNKVESALLYSGCFKNGVHLGSYVILFSDLFRNYEFLHKGDWVPFGVEDEL